MVFLFSSLCYVHDKNHIKWLHYIRVLLQFAQICLTGLDTGGRAFSSSHRAGGGGRLQW
jgi:hypothetical protein